MTALKRIGVFVFFDKDGIVDDYEIPLIESLREAVNDLIIVSNCYLDTKATTILSKYTDKLIVRPNVGLDAGAFKDVYDTYHEYFKSFDELLLVNDTFYGPFESFKDICIKMETKKVDFWGLTANYDSVDGYGYLPDGKIHAHIQTFFIAFRKSVLTSEVFNNYWQNYDLNAMNSFINVVTKHEIAFTYYLEKNGFTWDTYVNLDKYKCDDIRGNFNIYAYCSYDLIKNLNCPFIKRKNFVFNKKDALFLTDGSDARRSLDYIKKYNLYDTRLIMNNLKRLYSPNDLYYGLDLNYVLNESTIKKNNYCILLILQNVEYIYEFINYLKGKNINNLYIISENSAIKKILDAEKIKNYSNDDIDLSKYEYIGILKDSFYLNQKIRAVYNFAILNVLDNLLYSNEYIYSVVETFEENEDLGLLLLPNNLHSNYFDEMASKNDDITYSNNGCWLKKELFDWNLLEECNWLETLRGNLKSHNLLFGKVYNQKCVNYNLINYEYALSIISNSLKKHHGTITSSLSEALYHITHTKVDTKLRKLEILSKRVLRKIKRILKNR